MLGTSQKLSEPKGNLGIFRINSITEKAVSSASELKQKFKEILGRSDCVKTGPSSLGN